MTDQEQIIKDLKQEGGATDQLIECMFRNIGTVDPVLRDEIIYQWWIQLLEEQRLSLEQKRWLLKQIQEQESLFLAIDTVNDAVFTRSFTSLLLVLLIEDHKQKGWLTLEEQQQIIAISLTYMAQEKDNRGFVEGKGWAHAFAHGADLLGSLSQLITLTTEDVMAILNRTSRALIEIDDFLYSEEARFSIAIIELIKNKKLAEKELKTWIDKNNNQLLEAESFNFCWSQFLLTLTKILDLEKIEMPTVQASSDVFFSWMYKKFGII